MKEALEKAVSTIIEVADPDKIILFGSRSKGDSGSESDYDFLVLKKGVKKPRELSRKIYRSFSRIGAPVDIIVSDTDQYERLKDDPHLIYTEADKHGRVLYEKP
jgi:predicted nucleotidyltransferase